MSGNSQPGKIQLLPPQKITALEVLFQHWHVIYSFLSSLCKNDPGFNTWIKHGGHNVLIMTNRGASRWISLVPGHFNLSLTKICLWFSVINHSLDIKLNPSCQGDVWRSICRAHCLKYGCPPEWYTHYVFLNCLYPHMPVFLSYLSPVTNSTWLIKRTEESCSNCEINQSSWKASLKIRHSGRLGHWWILFVYPLHTPYSQLRKETINIAVNGNAWPVEWVQEAPTQPPRGGKKGLEMFQRGILLAGKSAV